MSVLMQEPFTWPVQSYTWNLLLKKCICVGRTIVYTVSLGDKNEWLSLSMNVIVVIDPIFARMHGPVWWL